MSTTALLAPDVAAITDAVQQTIIERIEQAIGRTFTEAEWAQVADEVGAGLEDTLRGLEIPVAS